MSAGGNAVPLSGEDHRELGEALVEAFDTLTSLRQMVRLGLGENLHAIALGENLREIVFKLIEAAEAEGFTDRLLVAALKERPENARLQAFAARRGIVVPAALRPLPPNNLPPRRLFVGRDEELSAIARALDHEGLATITPAASLYGLGGIGKTALALEYAHRNASLYPGGIFWLIAEGKPDEALLRLSGELRVIAPGPVRVMLDKVPPDAPAADVANAVRLALKNHVEPLLLILDNVDNDGWKSALPGGKVRVLLTTRDKKLGAGKATPVDVLPPERARELAQVIAEEPPSESDKDARERVLVAVGGLAIAVEIAARAVADWAGSWSEYGRLLEQKVELLDESELVMETYGHGALAALDLSIDRCAVDTPERRLLEGAAVFAPDKVPIEWAEKAAAIESGSIEVKKALAGLLDKGLVKVGEADKTLSLHQLLHARVRAKVERERWIRAGRRAAGYIGGWLEKTVEQTQVALVEQHRAHVDEVLLAAQQAQADVEWIQIADRLATHLQYRAAYDEAYNFFKGALAKEEQLDPQDLRAMATRLSNFALLLKILGRASEAWPLMTRALEISEMLDGCDHPIVGIRLGNVAMVLDDMGKPLQALQLLERALEIQERAYGQEHPVVATTLSHLASSLRNLQRVSEARPLAERALKIDEKVHGPEHPEVAIDLANLAVLLKDLGEPLEARRLLERALRICEITFGVEHPTVALILSNLAAVLSDLGRGKDARSVLERASTILDKTLPPEHPARARAHMNLSLLSPRRPRSRPRRK